MKFSTSTFTATLLVASLVAPALALAASAHFLGAPTFTDNGTTLKAKGSVAGLGEDDIDVELTTAGIASVTCSNPAGNVAPGQDTEVSASATKENLEPKNGRVNFTLETTTPTVTGAQACPNAKWTATVTDVEFVSATITVFAAGTDDVLLTQTFQL